MELTNRINRRGVGFGRTLHSQARPACSARPKSPIAAPSGTLRWRSAPKAMGESGNCITEATSKSIIASAAPPQGGGGPNDSQGGSGGGDGGGSNGGGGAHVGKGDGSEGQGHPMQLWTYLYAALLGVGGLMGYVKKGSSKSLGGGLSAALVLGLAARSMGSKGAAGAQVAFGISLLMGVFFLARFVKSKKVMPGGVGAGVSLGMAAGYLAVGL
ncbi:transmembrane proteins 14C-domain-containing protein [Dunaliella salina]|uniref:Transmembrane proteins 14C-domain-containing protein n=1 Tax=Dunaliella salina TaxID=3046 RepID=A0ABQ7H4R1_DUNSA|nr:transmembrane proteins 14C-domain-containing protein [Dunaliella salina]|eukprot:KAF5841846.1 transmembrane proteins 14C-domain-containing protein [Dunaliella salina]